MSFFKRIKDAANAFLRGYDAASLKPRFPARQTMNAPATEGLSASPIIGARAAHAVMNDPHAAAILQAYATDIAGPDGPSVQHPDARLTQAWNERFWASCDAEGISHLGHYLARLVRSFVIYGEAFSRFVVDPETGALRLQLIPVAQIDRNDNEDLGELGWVIAGIHIARSGRRLRYRVLETPPDHPFASLQRVWIDAADMAHVIDPAFPGEVRGISPLTPSLTTMVETDQLTDALLMQQKVAALLCAFVSDPGGTMTLGELIEKGKVEMQPGTVSFLPADANVTMVSPPDPGPSGDFVKHLLRAIAAGVGLPAWKVSADLSDVNFSSARMGDFAWRRRAGAIQRLIEGQFLNPAFRRFVALEVAAGRLEGDVLGRESTFADPHWVWPAWPQINPKEETEADALAVEHGFVSRASIIAKYGRDPAEVDGERDADKFRPAPNLKVVNHA